MYSKSNGGGIITALFYHVSALLLPYSKHLSGCRFLCCTYGFQVNSIATFTCYTLGIRSDKLFEKSLGSLIVTLSTAAVLFLVLLVIVRPRTDLGFPPCLQSIWTQFRVWVVGAICFVIFGFKCWLVRLELVGVELYDHPPLPTTIGDAVASIKGSERFWFRDKVSKSEIIEALIVAGFPSMGP